MPKKYSAARVVATIFIILGWIIVVVGIIASIAVAIGLGEELEFETYEIVGTIVGGIVGSLLLGWALLISSYLLNVAIDIAKNTGRLIESGE